MTPALVIFDMDGVLVDTSAANVEAYQHACRMMGLPVPAAEDITPLLGLPADEMARRLGCPRDRIATFLGAHAQPRYREVLAEGVDVYPGVRELVAALRARGARIAVWTTGDASLQELVLAMTGLRQSIDFLHAPGAAPHPKPDPRGLEEIVERFDGMRPRYLVDDRGENLEAGRRIGAVRVLAAYGLGGPGRDPADAVIRSPGELLSLLPSPAGDSWEPS